MQIKMTVFSNVHLSEIKKDAGTPCGKSLLGFEVAHLSEVILKQQSKDQYEEP